MEDRKEKKEQFAAGKKRGSLWMIIGLVVVLVAGLGAWNLLGTTGGKHRMVSVNAGLVSLALADVNDGKAHFYSVKTPTCNIDFFVVKSHDGVIRTAFDTCDVCYREKKGYRQEGDVMVCNNCNQQFKTELVNEVKGGCNPAPLASRIEGDRLVINVADLTQGSPYFDFDKK